MSKAVGVSLANFSDSHIAFVPSKDPQTLPTSLAKTGNSLAQLFSAIKESNESISTTVVAVDLAHHDDESSKSEVQESASKAGVPFAYTITHAGAYVSSMSPEDKCEHVLCIQAGSPTYSTVLHTQVNQYDDNKRVYSVEHKVTEVDAQEPLKHIPTYTLALVQRFVLLPPTAPTNLETFADALRIASPNISIEYTTHADLARGAAINAAHYGLKKPVKQTTGNPVTLLPVAIATSDQSLLTILHEMVRLPKTLNFIFTTAKEGQTKVSIPVLVGAYGTKLSEHGNASKVCTRVVLDRLHVSKTSARPRVRLQIRVDSKTEVELKVEQVLTDELEGVQLPSIVVKLPRAINDAEDEVVDQFDEMVEVHGLVVIENPEEAGELGDE